MYTPEPSFLDAAIEAANEALSAGDHPYGAVVVKDSEVIAVGRNRTVRSTDPSAHAEVDTIRTACKDLRTLDLRGCILYTTCEPCAMCLALIGWVGIGEVVSGVRDPDVGGQTAGRFALMQPRITYVEDNRCAQLMRTAKQMWRENSPATVRRDSRETALMSELLGGAGAVFQLYERQVLAVEQSGNSFVNLAGLLLVITTAAAQLFSATTTVGIATRVLVGAGTLLAFAATTIVIIGISRFRWASALAAACRPSTESEDAVSVIRNIRDKKTRRLNYAVCCLIASLGCFATAVLAILFEVPKPH